MTTDLRTIDFVTDIETSYRDYAIETIVDRALPRVEDGLKPVQRRILYAMQDLGLHPTRPYKKSARVVGEVLGKYHPHGDVSVYGAVVRLAQDFSLAHPLIEGQGNFGSIDGDAPAAMRYTEARLAPITELMMQDIERETVDWVDNFDGSLKEPEILPAVLPNLLVNGVSGVAVGVTTNMPPHNLGEVCDGLLYLVGQWPGREKVTVDALMNFVPGPDFPTGGIAYRYRLDPSGAGDAVVDTIRAAYETGRGRIVTQARIAIEGGRGGKADIVITELPYAVQKSTVLERIAKEVRDGRISGVTDLRDESDYSGLRIVVEVSRLAEPTRVLESLLTHTQLRQTFGVINRALKKESGQVIPHLYSLPELLVDFVGHRLLIVERRSRHEAIQRETRLHLVEGLLKALDVIDQVIDTIRRSKNTETAQQDLVKKFNLSQVQARAILDMQLRRLAALERQKLSGERTELQARLKDLQELLASEAKRLDVIAVEIRALKEKFAIPRRTIILDREEQAAGLALAPPADLAAPEGPQVVAITTRGIWRGNAGSFSDQVKPGASAKAVEPLICQLNLEPAAGLVLVSNRGQAWRAPVGRVPEKAGFIELGLEKGETIIGAGAIDPEQYLVVGTRAGSVKRVQIKDLATVEASWATIIGLKDQKDEVLFAAVAGDDAWVMFFTAGGKAIRFSASQVSSQSTPSAKGVAGIKLGTDDTLIAGAVVEDEGAHILIVSQAGYIKSVPVAEFPVQGRGGQGVQSLHITKATGAVAAAAVARPEAKSCDVFSGHELRYRVPVQDIPLADRRHRGARLVKFGPDDVFAAAVVY